MPTSPNLIVEPASAHVVDPAGVERIISDPGIPLPGFERLVGVPDGVGSSLIRYAVPAGFAPPPVLHRHTRESCVGYVLRGSLTYWFEDGEPRTAAAGMAVVLPLGAWFRWANSSATETAEALFWFTPGGFDQFFFDIARGLEATGYDMSRFGPILFETRDRYGDEQHPG